MSESGLLPTLQRILGRVKEGRAHFEGGFAALIGVTLTLVAALLGAPRATEPLLLPLPEPHRTTLARNRLADQGRAQEARLHGLSFETRAVGEALRRFGLAVAVASADTQPLLANLRARAAAERRAGHEAALLGLRALQTELFVAATHVWESSGKSDPELRELGGDFPELAARSGWLAGRTLVLEDEERALLFRMRWNDLTGLGDRGPFAATLDEYRDRYALLLRHPSGASPTERLRRQLGYVAAVEKLDHDYPSAFARGVLLYRGQAYEEAADAFRLHLRGHPDGPWTLRAKNHLLEALAHTPAED